MIKRELLKNVTVQEAMGELEELDKRGSKLMTLIRAIQDCCHHNMVLDLGHDSHYNYVACDKCGHEERC